MLAVKLHKHKKPWLGKYSHLVPILSWNTGKTYITRWIYVLNHQNRTRPNNRIRYITLVKIPDDHPVILAKYWYLTDLYAPFEPLSSVWQELKKVLFREYLHDGGIFELPQLILGKPLPPSCIKWTKRIQLLYYGSNKNPKRKSPIF